MQFYPLETLEQWQTFQSLQKTRFILKLSPVCPISYSAERRVEEWLKSLPAETDLIYTTVDVIDNRQVSRVIAKDLDIKHESPQVICVGQDGNVLWHGSHHQIKIEALQALGLGANQNSRLERAPVIIDQALVLTLCLI